MTESPSRAVRNALEAFVTELRNEVDLQAFEAILTGKQPLSDFDIGYKPETFTKQNLIHPILDAADLRFNSQPKDQTAVFR